VRLDPAMVNEEIERLSAEEIEQKIERSLSYIRGWYEKYNGDISVSFSGGMDSTVLLHLVRSIYPDTPAVFCDTGLEYPEIKEHVNATPGVATVRPEMPFREVLKVHGYPVISKKVAKMIEVIRYPEGRADATKRLYLTGITKTGRTSKVYKLPNKWKCLIDAPFKISAACCDELKKKPLNKIKNSITGTRIEESQARWSVILRHGVERDGGTNTISPLSFWKEYDIWDYIDSYSIPYSRIYSGECAQSRTGCMFCLFGVHMEAGLNRFQAMALTHPKQWKYCMDKLGIRKVMDFIGLPCEPTGQQLTLFKGEK